jgi:hypothetical protein
MLLLPLLLPLLLRHASPEFDPRNEKKVLANKRNKTYKDHDSH